MQDTEDYPFDPPDDKPSGWSRARAVISTAVGALVAMALLMALGIWFYRLGVRDAENVPIIRAALEPEKERPADPGGAVTPHQGVTAYEVADGSPASAASVVLAPDAGEPSSEEVAMGELAPVPADPTQATPEPPVAALEPPQPGTPSTGAEATPQATPTETEVAVATQPEAPVVEPEPDPDDQPDAVTGGTEYAPSDAPVAAPRPANLEELARRAVERDRQAADDLVARAASSPFQIQLAADPDPAVVRRLWDRIRRAHGDLLGERALATPTTVSGGVTYYRLRVGPFRDANEAKAICEALKARGQDCIFVRNG